MHASAKRATCASATTRRRHAHRRRPAISGTSRAVCVACGSNPRLGAQPRANPRRAYPPRLVFRSPRPSAVSAQVALVFDDYTTAQELFLASSRPVAALEMRRDLLHWEGALKLAKTLAPEQVPYISREFAQQLEFRGEHGQALDMYQKGLAEGQQIITTGAPAVQQDQTHGWALELCPIASEIGCPL